MAMQNNKINFKMSDLQNMAKQKSSHTKVNPILLTLSPLPNIKHKAT